MKRVAAILISALFAAGALAAEPYPSRPVRVLIGFPPSSAIDIVARTLAEEMGRQLGQPVLVENRTGAGGTLATQAVARTPADGYLLNISGCSADAIVYAFIMTQRAPLDPFKDFVPVARLTRDHWVVAVSPALGVNSMAELIALGKSKPGSLSFPSIGTGTGMHLQGERFRMLAGFEATHVPYKDSAFPDLIAGRLSFTVQPAAAVASLIRAGKLKGIAVLSRERLSSLPDVPTSAEAGLPELVYNAGICLFAPGGTPNDVVRRLSAALNEAAASPEIRRRFAELGLETVQGTPEDAARFVSQLMSEVDVLRVAVFGRAR